MTSNLSYSPETLYSGQNQRFVSRVNFKFDGRPCKTIGHLFYSASSCVHHFITISEFHLDIYSPETPILGQNQWLFASRDLEIWQMTLKNNITHFFCATSSFVHRFKAIGEFKLELQFRNASFGSKSTIFYPCDFEIWRMTLNINRAPLLSNNKLCASCCHHMWIQTGVMVRKQLIGVSTSVTLPLDLWPRPFLWTSLLSLAITLKILWWYDDGNIVEKVWQTDGKTDGHLDKNTNVLWWE